MGSRSLKPPCSRGSLLTKPFLSRTWRQTAFIILRLSAQYRSSAIWIAGTCSSIPLSSGCSQEMTDSLRSRNLTHSRLHGSAV